jgi:CBS domain-containing protein
MAIEQQQQFLQQIAPFNELDDKALGVLAQQLDVVYFPVNARITVDSGENAFVYFVIKGHIAELADEMSAGPGVEHAQNKAWRAHYAVRSFLGEQVVLNRKLGAQHFSVQEEAILYRLPAPAFAEALQSYAVLKQFFEASLVERLNAMHASAQMTASTEIMMDTVCSAPIRALVEVDAKCSLQEAAQKMVALQSDACVVQLPEEVGERMGIVTSTDVLRALASTEFDQRMPVWKLANWPLVSVHEFDYLFNALLKITRHRIDRLVVRSDDGLRGFLTQKDLMGLFANQSGLALLKIEQAGSVADFKVVAQQIDELVVNLHRKGIKTHYIAKLVNELHRKLIEKLFEMWLPENLQERVALLVMGSEGRSEQVLRTDQDNALIFDGLSAAEVSQLQASMQSFTAALIEIGFPPCPGKIMVSNPMWCQSLEGFKAQLKTWFDRPTEEGFMHLAIFYDAQVVVGQQSYLERLRQLLFSRLRDNPMFLRHFAKAALQFDTPIGFFGGLKTDNQGGHARLDLKKGAIFPIVHGVRCLAMEAELTQTNTHWRIKALMDKGVLTEAFGIELGEALNYFNALRLESMLYGPSHGDDIVVDNALDVQRLSHLQQDLLKQALSVVERFKKLLQRHFKLHEVM